MDLPDGGMPVTASLFKLERTNIKSTDPTTNTVVPLGVQRTNGLERPLRVKLFLADSCRLCLP